MMRATMVSISVKPASPSAPTPRLLFNAHIAGQPIDANGCPPGAVAQDELAAAGAAVGKKAQPHQVVADELGAGDLDVDRQAWGKGGHRRASCGDCRDG